MNSKLLIPLIIVVAIIGGVVFYMLTANTSYDQSINQPQGSNNAAGTIEEGSGQMVDASDNPIPQDTNSNRYPTYSKQIFDETANKRRVLYFYANWCPTCKIANEEFSSSPTSIPDDVVVIRVNYNDTDTDKEEQDLARKYNITYQHTFVEIDENGNEIKKWNGGGLDKLLQNLN